jgi:hypothetical protein
MIMEIQETILNEIKQIESVDFWEDSLLIDYHEFISKQNQATKEDIFSYLLDNIDSTGNGTDYAMGFILDLLTSPVFDSETHFLKLIEKFNSYDQDFIFEKIIDNLRGWNLSEIQKEQLFSLQKNIKNKSSLIFNIIENENKGGSKINRGGC